MAEVQDKVERYQWIKGDNFGKIVEVESIDEEFINFTDGTRIFKTIVSEFLEQVKDNVVPLPGADTAFEKISNINQSTQPTEVKSIQTPKAPAKEPSIMGKMIMKMSKKNVVNVPIQINLNIPTPQLYGMLSDGMEAEDLNEEIMAVALQQLEIDKLQDYVKSNITEFLDTYYNNI